MGYSGFVWEHCFIGLHSYVYRLFYFYFDFCSAVSTILFWCVFCCAFFHFVAHLLSLALIILVRKLPSPSFLLLAHAPHLSFPGVVIDFKGVQHYYWALAVFILLYLLAYRLPFILCAFVSRLEANVV